MDRVFKLPATTFIGGDKDKALPLRYDGKFINQVKIMCIVLLFIE